MVSRHLLLFAWHLFVVFSPGTIAQDKTNLNMKIQSYNMDPQITQKFYSLEPDPLYIYLYKGLGTFGHICCNRCNLRFC